MHRLPHAFERLDRWSERWERSGVIVLLLDFDGTLAPIVDRPEAAAMHPRSRAALTALERRSDVSIAIISGRSLADARALVRLDGVAYAGNHGMEIEIDGMREVHSRAASVRPRLDRVAMVLRERLHAVAGALVEDKGLTLSVHYRMVDPEDRPRVRAEVGDAAEDDAELAITEGKMVLEIRPRVDWHKGRAVEFLLDHLRLPDGAPVLYAGDDRTDEDAFRALQKRMLEGEGILVAEEQPAATAATAWVRSPDEVADLLEVLAGHR